jgi:hypothetical protein
MSRFLGRPIPELKQADVSIAFQNADMNGAFHRIRN